MEEYGRGRKGVGGRADGQWSGRAVEWTGSEADEAEKWIGEWANEFQGLDRWTSG